MYIYLCVCVQYVYMYIHVCIYIYIYVYIYTYPFTVKSVRLQSCLAARCSAYANILYSAMGEKWGKMEGEKG